MTIKPLTFWIGALFMISLTPSVSADNVCRDKHWLASPIIALPHTSSPSSGSDSDGDGIGGTGHDIAPPPETNIARNANDDGIGGTGHEEGIGGTGIVGMIAGFGSICIAGQEIFYDQQTPVWMDGQATSYQSFGLGQMVSVRAVPIEHTSTNETYMATEIHILHEVNGWVSSVADDRKSFSILGQQIDVSNNAPVPLTAGQKVAVSGYRLPNGHIQATRIASDAGDTLTLIGQVDAVEEQELVVAGQTLQLSKDDPKPIQGSEVRIHARQERDALIVQSWQENPRVIFSAPVEKLFIQRPEQMREGKPDVRLERIDRLDRMDRQEKPVVSDIRDTSHLRIDRADMPLDRMTDVRPDLPKPDHDRIPVLTQDRFDLWRELPPKPPITDRPPRDHR